MTEKQHEALDGSDLDKEESEADRQEVEGNSPSGETSSSGLPAIAAERQRGARIRTKASAAAWTSVADRSGSPSRAWPPRLSARAQKLGQKAPFEKIEKEGPIIARRLNRELVVHE